jgi:hypothetical protein
MARVRITPKTIQAKLTKWSQGQEIADELIYFSNEINAEEWKQKAWDLANMIIDVQSDSVSGFNKIIYKEKL